jgi:hypothetical protein
MIYHYSGEHMRSGVENPQLLQQCLALRRRRGFLWICVGVRGEILKNGLDG